MGLFNPHGDRFNLAEAEEALGISDEDRRMIRLAVSVDLLLAHAGITDDQVSLAYERRLRNDIGDAAESLASLINRHLDPGDEA